MLSPYDFDNLAGVAQDRHGEMLAQARQQRLLNEVTPARPHEHSVWQWLKEVIVGIVRHAGTPGSPGTRHSIQHH